MSDTKPPSAWDKALEIKGWTQERLAEEAKVSKATVNRMVRGQGRPNSESVRKVAGVLTDGDTDAVWTLVNTGHFDYGDFPIESIVDELRLLTPKQRKSLIAVVRSMSDPEGKRSGDVAHAAKKSNVTEVDFGITGPEPSAQNVAQTEGGPSLGQQIKDQQDEDAEDQ